MTDRNNALRLADELEQRFWPTSTHYYLDRKAADELRNLVAQRDQLVQVLKDCEIALRTVAKDDEDFHLARHQMLEVSAAIKAVEQ